MITAVINGFAKSGQKATFAVWIKDNNGNEHKRTIPLVAKSINFAELAALKYALLVITNRADANIIIKTSMKYIPTLFTKKDSIWSKTQYSYKKLVNELRELSAEFSYFDCQLDLNSEEMIIVRNMTRNIYK